MPVPRLFDMRRPSAASTVEWMITSVNGTSPTQLEPRPDHPVLPEADDLARGRVDVAGVVAASSGVCSGQPSVAYGHSAEENQVSSTSGSRSSSVEPHSAHASGAGHAQVTWPSGQYQSGSWCPHQSWREMFQSGISSSERIANWCCDSGW